MRENWRRRLCGVFASAVAVLALSPQIGMVAQLPDQMVLHTGSVAEIPISMAVSAGIDAPGSVVAAEPSGSGSLRLTAASEGEANLTFRLLGILPVGSMKVSVQPERWLVPGGQSVGVAINTDGLVVVGASDLGVTPSPARLAGIKTGDVIQTVDGETVTSAAALSAHLQDGVENRYEILRDGEVLTYDIAPALDERDGAWRLGVWVRDSTAGVGTLTFYDPQSSQFGALGHAITDVDTGVLMPVGEGAIYENSVVNITRSQEGTPGELTGDFFCTDHALGDVLNNSDYGIFGTADAPLKSDVYPDGLPIASRSEVHTGAATLLTTIDGEGVREYDCEITRISDREALTTRSMVVRITDPELIEQTGGIVQGMSGSPLIQDGKIIGAVTHVMVNDPTMGYGIFIENMLEAVD